jgi:hypothetical protein
MSTRRTAGSAGDFSDICNASQPARKFETHELFDTADAASSKSPLDLFLANANSLNLLYLPAGETFDPLMGTLILLGYVSAVESYIRAIVRGLIRVDAYATWAAKDKQVSFGAALSYSHDLLPEALLERTSLASGDQIKKTFRELIGFELPMSELKAPLETFERVCQLRHCCTHRFGRLGTYNAEKLGLRLHRIALDKPLKLDAASLTEIADNLRILVKTLNRNTFGTVLKRTVQHSSSIASRGSRDSEAFVFDVEWHWKFQKDRTRFLRYYDLFKTVDDPAPSPPARDLYDRFKAFHNRPRP